MVEYCAVILVIIWGINDFFFGVHLNSARSKCEQSNLTFRPFHYPGNS